MIDDQNGENPDRMTPTIAVLGYGAAIILIILLFTLAAPVTT